MTDEKPPKGRTAIYLAPGASVKGMSLIGNTANGLTLLDASEGTLHDFTMTANKVFGAEQAVRLGDVFGAKIQENLFDVSIPKELFNQIVEAGATEDGQATFRRKMADRFSDPGQLTALIELAEKIWEAGKAMLSG